jgi:xanthine dehydrogenase YagS FAD-binding subunit
MKDNVLTPDHLVNLKTIPGLYTVKEERSGFRIGALTTLADVEDHSGMRDKLLILSSAAGEAASPQIRNAGTIGGNICSGPSAGIFAHPISLACAKVVSSVTLSPVTAVSTLFWVAARAYIVHPSDTATALVALDAQIKIAGSAGERTIPLEKFFVLPSVDYRRENILKTAEIVTEIYVRADTQPLKDNIYKVKMAQDLVRRGLLESV